MIQWLVKSSSYNPDLKVGLPPPGLLSDRETLVFSGLRTAKRRHDWLLGRYTSKLLVQALVRQFDGFLPPLNDLIVENDSSGAPFVTCEIRYNPFPVSISISHSGDRAFCAAAGLSCSSGLFTGLIGADIERIESRPDGFATEYFTETETALIDGFPAASRDLLVTATWSAKEAAFKALRLGLTVNTRSAVCRIIPVLESEHAWTPFHIEWDVRRLNRSRPKPLEPPYLQGWWRILDGYVLTLAAEQPVGEAVLSFQQEVGSNDQEHG